MDSKKTKEVSVASFKLPSGRLPDQRWVGPSESDALLGDHAVVSWDDVQHLKLGINELNERIAALNDVNHLLTTALAEATTTAPMDRVRGIVITSLRQMLKDSMKPKHIDEIVGEIERVLNPQLGS